jgi:hypothetical protein
VKGTVVVLTLVPWAEYNKNGCSYLCYTAQGAKVSRDAVNVVGIFVDNILLIGKVSPVKGTVIVLTLDPWGGYN